ncbi:MAG: 2Fe-2S iron-sulfur cluster binding domain-containing protein [Gammaproteobacteria bacterium]|nr:2Fe-2S iron-sulfur cluster binding domain-containing protein [Gammaproteobacteria bacterium]
MPNITYQKQHYSCGNSESVLECLTRHGVAIPSSCGSGVCQTCMMRAIKGDVPEEAQKGLKETQQAQHYFLACSCTPRGDLEVVLPADGEADHTQAVVLAKEPLSADIMRVTLRCPATFNYRAGQFITLFRDESNGRSYSIANVPELGEPLELHVQRVPGGQISGWIWDELNSADQVVIAGPHGDSFYLPDESQQGLLLIGTGSGLAPLWGIVRDALNQGHAGPIHLFHSSYNEQGLYLFDELKNLAKQHDNFTYTPSVSGAEVVGFAHGRADAVALAALPQLSGWRIHLCGNPDMVKDAKRATFIAGVSMSDIYSDPFEFQVAPKK